MIPDGATSELGPRRTGAVATTGIGLPPERFAQVFAPQAAHDLNTVSKLKSIVFEIVS